MTTIAAKALGNGKVRIAWDSQVTSGSYKNNGFNKVVSINGQFAVGVAGYLRYANIVHRASVNKIHPFDLSQPDFDGYGWLCDEVIPAWMKAVMNEKEARPDEEDVIPWGSALIALAGKVYSIGADFSVSESEGYDAIGSGGNFAVAAMHLGRSPKAAVEIASELDTYTGGTIKEMLL